MKFPQQESKAAGRCPMRGEHFDPFDISDPFPSYQRLRTEAPVACDRNTARDALVKLPDSTTATKVRNKSISSSGNMDLLVMLMTKFNLIRLSD
jgi:hypothetical protein